MDDRRRRWSIAACDPWVADVPVFLFSPVQHRVCVLDGKHTENLSKLLLPIK